MHAMSLPSPSGFGTAGGSGRSRLQPLVAIVLAHLFLFYAVYSGLLHRVVQVAMPHEVVVNFIAPSAPEKPAPLPAPQVASLVPPPAVVPPPLPVFNVAQPERAITVPQPAPAPTERSNSTVLVAAAAIPAPVANGPRTLTSGVEYIHAPQPVYPPASRRLGEQGKVVLRVLVNEKGLPDQVFVQTSSGFSRLDEAGRQAALRALFKPYVEDGRPVAVFVIVPLNFTLAS